MPRHIILPVTNDLTYDQRMQRIAGTLVEAGYAVELVGRLLPRSVALEQRAYAQTRLTCRFRNGFLFYAEYNLRLFAYLLRARYDAVGAVDFDTLPAATLASVLRGKRRVFDAHEYFTEVPEVTGRPVVKAFWAAVGQVFLPFYRHAYTVGPALARLFTEKYGIEFAVVRNVPVFSRQSPVGSPQSAVGNRQSAVGSPQSAVRNPQSAVGSRLRAWAWRGAFAQGRRPWLTQVRSRLPIEDWRLRTGDCRLPTEDWRLRTEDCRLPTVLYQGALNEGRGLEAAIDAMLLLPAPPGAGGGVELWLAGEGDLSDALRERVTQQGLEDRVKFLGFVKPDDLKALTAQAWIGLNLLENKGLSYYYSLANKFFDYAHAAVPGLTMNFPEYAALNAEHEVAVLLDELTPQSVAAALGRLLDEPGLYTRLQANCRVAAAQWNWENEKEVLLSVWDRALGPAYLRAGS